MIVVFQPHRYTRTASLWARLRRRVRPAPTPWCITDVYAAGEPPIAGVTGRLVADAVIGRVIPTSTVAYVAGRRRPRRRLPARLARPGDVVLTLGAGDLTTMPDVWLGRRRRTS